VAALGHVGTTVGDGVADEVGLFMKVLAHCFPCIDFVSSTYRVVARVDAEVGGESDGTAEEEQCVEQVNDNHQQWVEAEVLFHRRRDKVKEGEEGEDREEDQVVDDGRVSTIGLGDHVSSEGHDEKGPHKL
jgi:hypothetical protein